MSSAKRLSHLPAPMSTVPAGIPLLSSELFHQLGWDDLSESVKDAIRPDLTAYTACLIDERPINAAQEQRRRRILYWVECLRNGWCSEQTALSALAD